VLFLDTQKPKNKIIFPMAKYRNEEKLPDYQSFTTDKLVDLLHHENARTKQKNSNWTIFVQDTVKNKIHLFEDLPPTTKIGSLKASVAQEPVNEFLTRVKLLGANAKTNRNSEKSCLRAATKIPRLISFK